MKLKIKGINDGLLMTLPEGNWEDICASIAETLMEKPGFFRGANLFLEAGNLDLRVTDISGIYRALEKNGIHLRGIYSTSERTVQNCHSLGLLTQPLVPIRPVRGDVAPNENDKPTSDTHCAYIYDHTVRSGVRLERNDTIVILGDVNPGAEVFSERNIIVWGIIRSNVTAGRQDGEPAFISALGLEDAHLCINGVHGFFAKGKRKVTNFIPVQVRNENDELTVSMKER